MKRGRDEYGDGWHLELHGAIIAVALAGIAALVWALAVGCTALPGG